MLSRRYVLPLAVLSALALVPVVVHSYLGVQRDECADPFRLVPSTGRPEDSRRDRIMKRRLNAFQWKEGRLSGRDGLPESFYSVVRSYEAKKLYYLLEQRLLDRVPDSESIVRVQSGGVELPIRKLYFAPHPGHSASLVAAYLLVHDGAPVDNPYWSQLLAAPVQLFTGAKPMTAFFITTVITRGQEEAVHAAHVAWLEREWWDYRSICFNDSGPAGIARWEPPGRG